MSKKSREHRAEQRVLEQLQSEILHTSEEHDDAVQSAIDAAAARIKSRKASDPRTARFGGRRMWMPAALAAALVLALFILPRPGTLPDAEHTLRSSANASDTFPAHRAEIRAAPKELRWPAQRGASSYQVKVRDASGTLVWTSENVEETRVDLPSSAIPDPQTGGSFLWTVDVRLGAAQTELGPYSFKIIP